MKNFLLSIILISFGLFVSAQTYTVNISGIVEEVNTSNPIEGAMVEIMTDSANWGFYYNTVYTDQTGYYEDSFDVPANDMGYLWVSTPDCNGMMLSQTMFYSDTSMQLIADFEVCSDSTGSGCQAMFYYLQEPASYTLQFYDQSLGNPNTWSWSFGDGTSSSEQNPVHTYAAQGEYLVSLTIEGDTNCFSTVEQIVWVIGDSTWPGDCQAMFYYQQDPIDMFAVSFYDLSYTANGDSVSNWFWEFGDGNYSYEQNPVHWYNAYGTYQVCLTITDSLGNCTSTFCEAVELNNGSSDCQADFYFYPVDSVNWGDMMEFQFVDISTGNPDQWFWNFGDGTSSTEQNPIHMFAEGGLYDVCLSISNIIDSCESTYCQQVYVYDDTVVNCYTWFEYEQVTNLEYDFEGVLMDSDDPEFLWDFGDGTSGSGPNITHIFPENGWYEVTLYASDSLNNCFTQYTELLWVGEDSTYTAIISGHVYLADSLFADVGVVTLMSYDTIGNNVIPIDTTAIMGDNGYYEFEVDPVDQTVYFVLAELTDGSAYWNNYVPTYHLDAIHWTNAWPIFAFYGPWSHDVLMQEVVFMQNGPGDISGVVSEEATRGLLEGVEILILNTDNEPLGYFKTQADGSFDFGDLAYGTYIVHTEIAGIETIPVEITLSEESASAEISIVVKNGQAVLGLSEQRSIYFDEVGNVYPNPVLNESRVEIKVLQAASLAVSISNAYGQLQSSQFVDLSSGQQQLSLPTETLPQGLYLLQIKADDGIVLTKKFLKLR